MKPIKIVGLKEGDWITSNGINFRDKKGKFAIGRVKEFKVVFDKSIFIDVNKNSVDEKPDCAIRFPDKTMGIMKLDKKDLKDFQTLKTKL